MQHSLSSEQTLLTAQTFGSCEQLRTRASPSHLSFCRLERGDHSPQRFPRLPLCPAPRWVSHGDLTSLVPPWAEPGLSSSSPAPSWARRARQSPSTPAVTAPSSPVRHRPQRSYTDRVRGGFATQTEPGLGYECWLLHDMGYNWDIRQLLETALLLHANECFCCRILLREPAPPLPCCRFRHTER